MSIMTIVKEVKLEHPEYVVIVKIGKFYNVYLNDAYILSHIFEYKLRDVGGNTKSCGFPEAGLSKVLATLEKKKINYLILDRRDNYEIVDSFDIGNLNKYRETYNKAKKYTNLKVRIDNITRYLYDNINDANINDVIRKIEDIIL